jgi:hypothetical protein
MAERRTRTARRAGRASVASLALAFMDPNASAPPDFIVRLEHVAESGEDGGDVDSDLSEITERAFRRGWAAGLGHARAEQAAGRDPELWRTEPPAGGES